MDHWRFYRTADGGEVVKRDLAEWSREQKAAVIDLQRRYNADALLPREFEVVGDGIFALRTSLDGVELRLYFGKVARGGAVCLAVHVLQKKSTKIPKKDLRLAKKRLRDWNSRESTLQAGVDRSAIPGGGNER